MGLSADENVDGRAGVKGDLCVEGRFRGGLGGRATLADVFARVEEIVREEQKERRDRGWERRRMEKSRPRGREEVLLGGIAIAG